MNLKLYPHNHEAYIKVEQMLQEQGKAAVVHPTGTGKSYIAFALIISHPDKTFLWLSPNKYIYTTQIEVLRKGQGITLHNVVFRTYAWVTYNWKRLLDMAFDYVILDEFHRLGAKCWGEGVMQVLGNFPNAKVLGITATKIRYLDKKRDMAEELFEGAVASEMSVSEAMARGILPVPHYVVSAYSYHETLEQLQERVNGIRNRERREESQNLLIRLRHSLEQAEGIREIFAKHIKDSRGKYIVFCSNSEHLYEMISQVPEWFGLIDTHPHIYHVHTYNPKSQGDFKRFVQDESNHLKLLFAIDMINEGIHVKDVDGVVMLRSTESPIVYKQQIGRALATGGKKIPIIFDMVNNFDGFRYVEDLVREFEEKKNLSKYEWAPYAEIKEFRIFDEMKAARELFEQVQKNLDASWYEYYDELKRYVKENGNANVPRRYVTDTGMYLGKWLQRQKHLFRLGKLLKERGRLLMKLCVPMEYANKMRFEQWMKLLRQYKREKGTLLVADKYVTKKGEHLGNWCCYIRRRYRAGKLPAEKIKRLERVGFCWEAKKNHWGKGYEHAKVYYDENGHLDVEKRYQCPDGFLLGQWLATQRRVKAGKERGELTKERVAMLDKIGMRWKSRATELFDTYVSLYQQYQEKYGTTEVPATHREEGMPLGQWVCGIRKKRKNGKLSDEQIEILDGVGFLWDASFPQWYRQYEKAKEYYEKHRSLVISADYREENGKQLSLWIIYQRKLFKNKRFDILTKEKRQLLDEIGMDWIGRL